MRDLFGKILRGCMHQDSQRLTWCVNMICAAFDRECSEFMTKRHEWMEKLSEEVRGVIVTDRCYKLSAEFPALVMGSLFVSLYSHLEHQLVNICRHMQQDLALDLGPQDISGRGIEQAKTYLEKACRIRFPSNSRAWQEIKHYSKLRNLIVHTGGRAPLPKKNGT